MRYIIYLSFLLFAIQSVAVRAQMFNINELNYGFANYMGTGIYKVADREIQVYQIPFSYDFKKENTHKWQHTLRAPVTLGFYDFDSSDFLDRNLPDSISTFSFVPGIQSLYLMNENWRIGAFLDAGIVTNQEENETNNIYGTGIISYFNYDYNDTTITLFNRLLYARDSGSNIEEADDYASFETGLDFLFPPISIDQNSKIDFSTYYINHRYFDNLNFLRLSQRPVEVVIQHELGITFELKKSLNYKYLTIPRIGIGYRFGDNLSIIRIVIGSAF